MIDEANGDGRQPTEPARTWLAKFTDAFRGIGFAIRGSSSFAVHGTAAIAVLIGGIVTRVSPSEWCLLILCIAIVLSAEIFNSSIESLARAIDSNHHPELGRALDMASGGVLIVAFGAAAVGLVIFL